MPDEPQMDGVSSRYDALLTQAEEAVALSIAADGATQHYLLSLMEADGQPALSVESVMERFISYLADFGVLREALGSSTRMFDELYRAAIRDFFLKPLTTYTLAELAVLWLIPFDDVLEIYADTVIERTSAEPDFPPALIRVTWREAVETTVTYNLLSAFDVEQALGAEFLTVRTAGWRTRPVYVRLPEWLVERLEREPMIPASARLQQRVETILHLYVETGEVIGRI